jgi:hypothetical protein
MSIKTGFIALLIPLLFTACGGIKVKTDYEAKTDFSKFKTFAFYKAGIDKAPISDIDKRRIIRAISKELEAKGMTKSKTPDVLVSIFTKSKEQVDIYQNRWRPYYYGPYQRNQISKYTEGTLFIDIIEKEGKKLVWQGIGSGFLTKSHNPNKRVSNINKFVESILTKYPPEEKK